MNHLNFKQIKAVLITYYTRPIMWVAGVDLRSYKKMVASISRINNTQPKFMGIIAVSTSMGSLLILVALCISTLAYSKWQQMEWGAK